MKRKHSYSNSWETSDSLLLFSSEGQFMGGRRKTSTHDATASAPPSPCSKWKTGTSSVAIPTLSGHLTVAMLVIVMRCCSTCLNKVTSQTNEQARRYYVAGIMGLVLEEKATVNYVHLVNHLMVSIIAIHFQNSLLMISQLMVLVQTCSLTRRVTPSQ